MASLPESKISSKASILLFSGLKIAVTYSVMGAIIGEWLGASEGLGVMLTRATKSF